MAIETVTQTNVVCDRCHASVTYTYGPDDAIPGPIELAGWRTLRCDLTGYSGADAEHIANVLVCTACRIDFEKYLKGGPK